MARKEDVESLGLLMDPEIEVELEEVSEGLFTLIDPEVPELAEG